MVVLLYDYNYYMIFCYSIIRSFYSISAVLGFLGGLPLLFLSSTIGNSIDAFENGLLLLLPILISPFKEATVPAAYPNNYRYGGGYYDVAENDYYSVFRLC